MTFQHISAQVFPLLYNISFSFKSSSSHTVFMITLQEASLIGLCLEGFLYGKMFNLYALICGKEVQLFLGLLGLYSGIFAIYLQSLSNKSRTAIIFYSLCLLYVLSGATVVCDVLGFIFQVSNSFVKNIFFLINCAPAVPYDISIASSSN